jgi:hypothetical protein
VVCWQRQHRFGTLLALVPTQTDSAIRRTLTMTRSTLNTEIRSKIDAFVEQLTSHVKKAALDSVRDALGNGVAPARRGPSMKVKVGRPAKSAMKGGKRTPEQVAADAERIASYVRQHPGQRLEQIAAGLGAASNDLKLPVIKLLASKTLTKKGEKRGTMYFAGGGGGATKAKTKAKRGKKK